MITHFINRLISQKKELKLLDNGLKSSLSRIKVVLKSLKSRFHQGSFILPFGQQASDNPSNQHRAPPDRYYKKN
ncbi:MAG: hypothetical protein WAV89_05170 [Ignavibacteriaceae bacterium]